MSERIVDLSRHAMGDNDFWEIVEFTFWQRVCRWLGWA